MNFLFRNDNGIYKEVGVANGVAANSQGHPTGSMHGSIGDVDGDGLIDILVSDLNYGALYSNLGNGVFTDITESSGIADSYERERTAGPLSFLIMIMMAILIWLLLMEQQKN